MQCDRTLSKRALEIFVNDFKNQNGPKASTNGERKSGDASLPGQTFKKQDGLGEPKTDGGNLHVHGFELNLVIDLDEDVKNELIEMKKKGIDVNQLLRVFLRERKEKLARAKLLFMNLGTGAARPAAKSKLEIFTTKKFSQ